MSKRSIMCSVFVLVISIILLGCQTAYVIPIYYEGESYIKSNDTNIQLVSVSYPDEYNVITYEFNCYFGNQSDAEQFKFEEIWVLDRNANSSDFSIMVGKDLVHDFNSSFVTFSIDGVDIDDIYNYEFSEQFDYTILVEIDIDALGEIFQYELGTDYLLDNIEVRFMIEFDGAIFFASK